MKHWLKALCIAAISSLLLVGCSSGEVASAPEASANKTMALKSTDAKVATEPTMLAKSTPKASDMHSAGACKKCSCTGFVSDPNDETICIGARPPQGRCQHSYLFHPNAPAPGTVAEASDDGDSLMSKTEFEGTGKAPFICGGCGKVIAYCEGGDPGKECVWCSSPGGHCKCPLCGKEHYLISHRHT